VSSPLRFSARMMYSRCPLSICAALAGPLWCAAFAVLFADFVTITGLRLA